jgi:hypothetical protein
LPWKQRRRNEIDFHEIYVKYIGGAVCSMTITSIQRAPDSLRKRGEMSFRLLMLMFSNSDVCCETKTGVDTLKCTWRVKPHDVNASTRLPTTFTSMYMLPPNCSRQLNALFSSIVALLSQDEDASSVKTTDYT